MNIEIFFLENSSDKNIKLPKNAHFPIGARYLGSMVNSSEGNTGFGIAVLEGGGLNVIGITWYGKYSLQYVEAHPDRNFVFFDGRFELMTP